MYNKTKSIAISKETLRKLTQLKYDTELKSVNDVIEHLLKLANE